MTTLFSITEGWTDKLGPFTLRKSGTPFALTGYGVDLVLRRPDGTLVSPLGTITVGDQVAAPGTVYYTPASASDFTFDASSASAVQSYRVHWKITDVNGKIVFFPNDEADIIAVYRA